MSNDSLMPYRALPSEVNVHDITPRQYLRELIDRNGDMLQTLSNKFNLEVERRKNGFQASQIIITPSEIIEVVFLANHCKEFTSLSQIINRDFDQIWKIVKADATEALFIEFKIARDCFVVANWECDGNFLSGYFDVGAES